MIYGKNLNYATSIEKLFCKKERETENKETLSKLFFFWKKKKTEAV